MFVDDRGGRNIDIDEWKQVRMNSDWNDHTDSNFSKLQDSGRPLERPETRQRLYAKQIPWRWVLLWPRNYSKLPGSGEVGDDRPIARVQVRRIRIYA